MPTTKRILAEQCMRILSGGYVTKDTEFDIREIMLAVEQSRDKLVKQEIMSTSFSNTSAYVDTSGVIGSFLSVYDNVAINFDANKDLRYIDLPAMPLALPDDKGVYHVSYQRDQRASFVRMPNGSIGLYGNMPSSRLLGKEGYWVEQDRVYFNENVNPDLGNVLLKLVVVAKDILPNAPFPMPGELESEVVRDVVQLYTVMRNALHDEENDDIDR
tara:strand:- start:279 stop:923 length:645 start_codon:yes stop_codon:yes gene_type:complete